MCGRFTTTMDIDTITEHFKIDIVEGEYSPLYNAAPTQNIPVVRDSHPRKLSFFRWGLIPSWAKDEKIGYSLINARSETVAEKPSFRQSFLKKRCIIVADGFYEWKKSDPNKRSSSKQPYRITLRDNAPFAMAGLWEMWMTPQKQPLFTCTIITTNANSLLAPLHNRMPVILSAQAIETWLDSSVCEQSVLEPLLQPYLPDLMDYYPVSSLVNSPANNSPQVIQRSG